MSGGVDSAVAAARAVDAGHEVTGIHLALSRNPASYRTGSRGCCSIEDSSDARRAADVLGIPFYVWDLSDQFHDEVVVDFMSEYAAGRTPNPCLRCNEKIKFAAVLDKARALGFDGVVTGHYATVSTDSDGTAHLHRALDSAKDQSYVLGVLDEQQLARAFFPLGDSTKAQVRQEAAVRGFAVAKKPDSHDICFIADGDTRGWLTRRLGAQPGVILDEQGEVVGEHGGAYAFTVGQRKGLRLPRPAPDGQPRYVREVDVERNVVVVAPAELLGVRRLDGEHVRWCGDAPTGPTRLGAQVRAHGAELPATAYPGVGPAGSPTLDVVLDQPLRGVAPGQSVVLYDGTRVVGSATIRATHPR